MLLFYFLLNGLPIYSFHRFCPFSTGCTLYKVPEKGIVYTYGAFFFILLISASFFLRRFFCATFCIIGFVSDLLFLPKKIVFPNHRKGVNNHTKKLSVMTRNIVLSLTIFVPLFTGSFFFIYLCPIILTGDYIHKITLLSSLIVLISFIVASIFVERFFCRFICPLGFLMGFAGKIGYKFLPTWTLKKVCGALGRCVCGSSACPMNIDTCRLDGMVDDIDCIMCFECEKACPRNRKRRKTMHTIKITKKPHHIKEEEL